MNIGKEYLEVDIEQTQIIRKLRNLPKIDTYEAIINGRIYPMHTIINGVVLHEGETCDMTTNIKSIAVYQTLAKIGELLDEKNVVAIRVYPEVSKNGMLYQCYCRLAYEDKEKPTAEAFRNGIDNCKLCVDICRTNETLLFEIERLVTERDAAVLNSKRLNMRNASLELKIDNIVSIFERLKTHELVENDDYEGGYDWIERT